MIALIKGRVEETGDGWAVVDVGGVGYLVYCPGGTLARLNVGEAVKLHIETHVREDHIHLYGFMDTAEREWFRLLTTVQGVGARVGIAILSALSVDELTHAVAAGDKAQIGRANGVGPKLAARIATELKDKVAAMTLGTAGTSAPATPATTATRDAVSALVNLGYQPAEALSAVAHVAAREGKGVDVEALIKGGLTELGPKEHRA